MKNTFDKELRYKLYRTVREILHPTISKKNISNYKIILDEELLPVRVFYPQKVSNLESITIFIPGDEKITNCPGEYTSILTSFALTYNQLVITIDYENIKKEQLNSLYQKVEKTLVYLLNELIINNIKEDNITLAGDSTGASLILYLESKLKKQLKEILFYPITSGDYFKETKYSSLESGKLDYDLLPKITNYYQKRISQEEINSPNYFYLKNKENKITAKTLIICGGVDPLIDEARNLNNFIPNSRLIEVPFTGHGFLRSKDRDLIKEYQLKITEFLKNK